MFYYLRNFIVGSGKVLALIVLLSLFPIKAWAGLGITPPSVEEKDLLPSNRVKESIFLVRSNPSRDIFLEVLAEGTATPYLEFDKILLLPKGRQQTEFVFYIAPGKGASGEYKANIIFTETKCKDIDCLEKIDANNENMGVSVMLGVRAKVHFWVTNKERKEIAVERVRIENVEVNQKIPIRFTAENKGNVDARVDKVAVRFYEYAVPANEVRSMEILAPEIKYVSPHSREEQVIDLMAGLPKGRYGVEVQFFMDNKLLFSKDNFLFDVLPEGTLKLGARLNPVQLNKDTFKVGEMAKFTGKVANTGEVGVYGALVLELSKDGILLDVLKSDEQFVPVKGEVDFSVFHKITQKGQYSAKVYVVYGPYKTDSQMVGFLAGEDSESLLNVAVGEVNVPVNRFPWWLILLIILVIVAVNVLVILWILKRKKNNRGLNSEVNNSESGEKSLNSSVVESQIKIHDSFWYRWGRVLIYVLFIVLFSLLLSWPVYYLVGHRNVVSLEKNSKVNKEQINKNKVSEPVVEQGLDKGEVDTDQDGLSDKEEVLLGTDPKLVDTDGDGLSDYQEVKVYFTNPLLSDTDGDKYSDKKEVESGYNPLGEGKIIK